MVLHNPTQYATNATIETILHYWFSSFLKYSCVFFSCTFVLDIAVHKSYAFIDFESKESASDAVHFKHKAMFHGRPLSKNQTQRIHLNASSSRQ